MPARHRGDHTDGSGKDTVQPAEEEFIIPASDAKGQSAQEWYRCAPGISLNLDIIVQSKRFPYRSKGDIVRHALMKHFRWLDSLEPVQSVLRELEVIIDILRNDTFQRSIQTAIEKMGDNITQHMGEGSMGSSNEARRIIGMIQNRIDKMPDGYWKTRYLKHMKEKWGHVLDTGITGKLRIKKKEKEEG
jgi:hypothetical protein